MRAKRLPLAAAAAQESAHLRADANQTVERSMAEPVDLDEMLGSVVEAQKHYKDK